MATKIDVPEADRTAGSGSTTTITAAAKTKKRSTSKWSKREKWESKRIKTWSRKAVRKMDDRKIGRKRSPSLAVAGSRLCQCSPELGRKTRVQGAAINERSQLK